MNKAEALLVIGNLLERRQHLQDESKSIKKAILKMAKPFDIKVNFRKNTILEVPRND